MSSAPPSSPSPPSAGPSAPPGASPTSADGAQSPAQKPTILDAAKTISPVSDLQRLPQIPCARQALLFGIMAGASVGGLRFIFSRVGGRRGSLYGGGGSAWGEVGTAANWAVGAWGIGSLGAWETCRARQTAEAARMHALVSEIQAKRAKKAQRQAAAATEGGAAAAGGKPIGGILIGDKGKEILRERERKRLEEGGGAPAEVQEPAKGDKSWWQGRV
ncbi:hypothetical protein JCM6882_009361 [Rhodosporidiobolus microsporus]